MDIEKAVKQFLTEEVETNDEVLENTPKRVAKMLPEILDGYGTRPKLSFFDCVTMNGSMVVQEIPHFYSLCEHHLLPFHGNAYVAYIPNKKYIGASKLTRVFNHYAHRLQIQERLCEQVADFLFKDCGLNPKGVGVFASAEHLCMSIRGINKPGTQFKTSALRGIFLEDGVKTEFMNLVR